MPHSDESIYLFSKEQVLGLLEDIQCKPCTAPNARHDLEYRTSHITGTPIPVCKNCDEEFPPVFHSPI